jgi:hypothetical protein
MVSFAEPGFTVIGTDGFNPVAAQADTGELRPSTLINMSS